jgi:hypothetical protein
MRWSTTATTTTTAMIEEGERNKSKTARKQGKSDQYTAGRLTGKKREEKIASTQKREDKFTWNKDSELI